MSGALDPYKVLGVPRSATTQQIRSAYVVRARRSHPDLVGPRGLELMRDLNEAWEVLKDATRRAEYDAANGGPPVPRSGAVRAEDDPNRPFWTGASGPPPGRPSGSVLDFGIFAGWSLGEILRRDRGYLVWLRAHPEGKPYVAEIEKLLNTGTEEIVEPRRGWRR
ncbi:MAG TPA: J domain-containing protein [Candidatus Limnocylindrales bacterium]